MQTDKFIGDIISSNVGMIDIILKEAEKTLLSAKEHRNVFKYLLLELLISIQKRKINILFNGEYNEIINEKYFNYLKEQKIPEHILNSFKESFIKRYYIFEDNIDFEENISENTILLATDFLEFLDVQKGTSYNKNNDEIKELVYLISDFIKSTNNLTKEFILTTYK